MEWFEIICKKFGVKGSASVVYKRNGEFATNNITDLDALNIIKNGLRSENRAYIYHCQNHYMCPIGFEITPKYECAPLQFTANDPNENWIIIGDISKMYPVFTTARWSDIATDINLTLPEFFNIRQAQAGVQMKTEKKFFTGPSKGTNNHCILEFRSDE